METANQASAGSWHVVQFPTTSQLEEFLDQVALWNRVEGLPTLSVARLPNGAQLRVELTSRSTENILRLIEAFGGVHRAAETVEEATL